MGSKGVERVRWGALGGRRAPCSKNNSTTGRKLYSKGKIFRQNGPRLQAKWAERIYLYCTACAFGKYWTGLGKVCWATLVQVGTSLVLERLIGSSITKICDRLRWVWLLATSVKVFYTMCKSQNAPSDIYKDGDKIFGRCRDFKREMK